MRNRNDTITNVPEVPVEILKAAESGKLVLFVGAGVSRIIGCPSWKEFALKYLAYLYQNKCINYHEYENLSKLEARKLLSICRNLMGEKKLEPPDTKKFLEGKEELIQKYQIYESLYAFNCIFVTTNYDDYLDKIAEKPPSELPIVSEQKPQLPIKEKSSVLKKVIYDTEQLLVSSLNNGVVIHLHGSVKNEQNMIMTIVDYMNHYNKDSKPAAFLGEIFNTYTVLFVGYGLEEYEILEFIISKSHKVKGELRHFMLYPMFETEKNLFEFQRRYYEDLGIKLIPYPIDDNGYEHLATVIKEWANQIGRRSKPQSFFDKIKLIDEVVQ